MPLTGIACIQSKVSKFCASMSPRFLHSLVAVRRRVLGALAACALIVFAGSPALAEKADKSKPMNIEADSMRYDDLKQTSVFSGNVVVTKGTIVIRGARVNVRQDPEGYQYGTVTAAPGQRAYFKQKRDAPGDEWMEGEGEVIEYDSRAETVKLFRRAVMRRLVNTVVNDETTGALIVYDQRNDTYTVDGTVKTPEAGTVPGRVRAVLTPRQGTAASDAKTGADAASETPQPGLRSSTTLKSNKNKKK